MSIAGELMVYFSVEYLDIRKGEHRSHYPIYYIQ